MYDRSIKLCILVTLWFAGTLHADNHLPEWFEPFPLSSLENQAVQATPDYQLPLSQITRIQGLLRTQNERRLKGQLISNTWQLATGNTPEQGFDHVRDQLLRQDANILFECSSRQCGASNLWANQVFGYANLLGVDSSQFYLAAEIQTGHVAVYAIRRGNGRVYLHLDYIQSAPSAVAADVSLDADEVLTWQQRLIDHGYVDLQGWSSADLNTVEAILMLMDASADLQLRIVVHQRVFSGDTGLTETNAMAQRLETQLLDAGVTPERIAVFGVGSLSPSVLGAEENAITLIRVQE